MVVPDVAVSFLGLSLSGTPSLHGAASSALPEWSRRSSMRLLVETSEPTTYGKTWRLPSRQTSSLRSKRTRGVSSHRPVSP
eukprot:scaffold217886_cov30-Tisochrysis_lutea.AAC.5